MTREEWEDVLYTAVPDEVVQDQLNDYVLSLEGEVAKLRELVRELWSMAYWYVPDLSELDEAKDRMRELGIEVE